MATELFTAIIAGASAIGGGAIVAGSNYWINRAQARTAEQAELRRALGAFLAILNRIDHQLRIEPEGGKIVRYVNEQIAKFPQLDYTIGQARRRLFEPYVEIVVSRMHDAMADLLLLAPREVLVAIEAVNELMTAVDAADPAWWQCWEAARADLVAASRAVLRDRDIDAVLATPEQYMDSTPKLQAVATLCSKNPA